MTFAELAVARGISKDSAIALVRRKRWRRQRDNTGFVIALVPNDGPARRRVASDEADHHAAAFETALAAVEAAHAAEVSVLREHADAAEQGRIAAQKLADHALAQLADATARADRAEAAIAGERARADVLNDRIDDANERADRAVARAEQSRTEAEEALRRIDEMARADRIQRVMSRWARLRAAWRRE